VFDAKNLITPVELELWGAMPRALRRQEGHTKLIASENYRSPTVMQAQGSVLSNQYAGGYPGIQDRSRMHVIAGKAGACARNCPCTAEEPTT